MRLFVLWLLLVSVLPAEEELSIEAFWLGSERFRMEMAPEFDDEMPERVAATVKPEECLFISEGDVLWELSEHFHNEGFQVKEGWVVYNQTTGYLVAKSNAGTLWALEKGFNPENLAKSITVRLDVFEGEDERAEWVDWEKKWKEERSDFLFAAEVNGLSGQTQTSESKKDDLELSLQVQPTLSSWNVVDLYIAATFVNGDGKYQLNSGFSVQIGEDHFAELGRASEGPSLVARFRVNAVLVGGPLLSRWHLAEEAGSIVQKEKGQAPEFGDFEIPVPTKARVIGWEVPPTFANDLSGFFDNASDPYAGEPSTGEDEKKPLKTRLKRRELTRCFPSESWLDIKSLLADSGLDFEEEDYALFGQNNNIVVVRSKNPANFHMAQQLTATLGPDPRVLFQVVASVLSGKEGEPSSLLAKAVLPTRAGETVSQTIQKTSSKFEVEFQPTLGAGGQIVDLRYAVLFSSEESSFNVNSGTTFISGTPQKVLISKAAGESVFLLLQPLLVDPSGRKLDEQVYDY